MITLQIIDNKTTSYHYHVTRYYRAPELILGSIRYRCEIGYAFTGFLRLPLFSLLDACISAIFTYKRGSILNSVSSIFYEMQTV